MPKGSRPACRGLGVLAVAGLVIVLLLRDLPAEWLVLRDEPGLVDAAVVLAGDPGYERTATAARLVRAGLARTLIVTGGEPGPGDSAASLRERAMQLGVPAERIHLEAISHDTNEAVSAVAPLLHAQHVRSVALVTSPYHQRRAWLAARRAWPGVTIRNCPASPSAWSPRGWWRRKESYRVVVQEYAKLIYYFLRGWI